MPYRGRFPLGCEIPLGCFCLDSSGTPGAPTAAPTMKVLNSSGTAIVNHLIPAVDQYTLTGFFQDKVQLDDRFSVGFWTVTYTWVIAGVTYGDMDTFEIVGGGDADGAVIASFFYQTPACSWLVYQTDSGRLFAGRNPR